MLNTELINLHGNMFAPAHHLTMLPVTSPATAFVTVVSTLCLPEFVRFFYVYSAYACPSLSASSASAPRVPGVCLLFLPLFCLCLCLVSPLPVPLFCLQCVSAVGLFFEILRCRS